MTEFFSSGIAIAIVLAVMLIEGIALFLHYRRHRTGLAPKDFVFNLIAGACLLLALQCALLDGPWYVIVLALTASFAAHLADMRHRWRRAR